MSGLVLCLSALEPVRDVAVWLWGHPLELVRAFPALLVLSGIPASPWHRRPTPGLLLSISAFIFNYVVTFFSQKEKKKMFGTCEFLPGCL